MESGKGKHLSPVRHLLPQMTQSDCSKSRMEAQSIHNHRAEDSRTRGQRVVSLRGPTDAPWPQAFNQTSLLSTIKSAVKHPHGQGRRGGEEGAESRRENDRQRGRFRYNPVVPPDTSAPEHKRASVRPQSVFFFAKCLLLWCCLWHTADTGQQQQQCGDRQRQRGGGRGGWGGGSTDGITSVPLSYEKGRAEQSWRLQPPQTLNSGVETQNLHQVFAMIYFFFYTDGGTCRQSKRASSNVRVRGPREVLVGEIQGFPCKKTNKQKTNMRGSCFTGSKSHVFISILMPINAQISVRAGAENYTEKGKETERRKCWEHWSTVSTGSEPKPGQYTEWRQAEGQTQRFKGRTGAFSKSMKCHWAKHKKISSYIIHYRLLFKCVVSSSCFFSMYLFKCNLRF